MNLLLAARAAREASKDILTRFMVWLPGGTEDLRPGPVELVVDLPLDEEGAERGGLFVGAPKGLLRHGLENGAGVAEGLRDHEAVDGGSGVREKEWYSEWYLLKRGGESK